MSTGMKLIGFACFVLSLCFHGVVTTACTNHETYACLGSDHNYTPSRLQCQSRNLSRIQSCLENTDCQPSDAAGGSNGTTTPYSIWLITISNIDGLVYLCSNPDALRAVVQNDFQCYYESSLSYINCTDTSTEALIEAALYPYPCRFYNQLYECMYQKLKNVCGQEIAAFIRTYYLRKHRRHLASFGCSTTDTSVLNDTIAWTWPGQPATTTRRTGTNCDSQQIQRCTANIRERGTMDSAVYERICQNLTAASSCIDNVICAPTDSDYRDFQNARGIIEISRYVCQSDHRKATYVRQQRCLQNATASADARRCFDKFGVSDDIGSSSEFRQCRGLNAQTRCIFNVTNSQCGEDIARIVTTAYQKATPAYLPGCAVDTSYMPAGSNGMTSSMTSSAMMFISLLLLLLSRR